WNISKYFAILNKIKLMSLPPRKFEQIQGKLDDEIRNRKHQVNPQQVVDIQMQATGNLKLTTNQLRSV
ncbi:MAG: hypothetical protein ACK56F_17685, partial [bacterium]